MGKQLPQTRSWSVIIKDEDDLEEFIRMAKYALGLATEDGEVLQLQVHELDLSELDLPVRCMSHFSASTPFVELEETGIMAGSGY